MLMFRFVEILRDTWKADCGSTDLVLALEILQWVLQADGKQPLKTLYIRSRYSQPTIRACIRTLVRAGMLSIDASEADARCRFVSATSYLKEFVTRTNRKLIAASNPAPSPVGSPMALAA